MGSDAEILDLCEVILTAEIFNQDTSLETGALTPRCRDIFGAMADGGIRRPVTVSAGTLTRGLGVDDPQNLLSGNPFISFEPFGQRFRIPAPEAALKWLVREGGLPRIEKNPVLARYAEQNGLAPVSYQVALAANPPLEDTRIFLDGQIAKALEGSDELKGALDLAIIRAPEEVEQEIGHLVLTPDQKHIIAKIQTALQHRHILRSHRIHEVGKLLFVGPPGTGKTSLALAMSREFHVPVLEVRLSMVTSQYLGETSKNIDRIFTLAKQLAPCILFIDEFDYVAKSRTADDHGAMKRAVNSLLKNIDQVSLVRNHLLLIGATNHPQLLDEAAWRRFDEVVEFSLPDPGMRRAILEGITSSLRITFDIGSLADLTEGFSGADLRLMVKEAVLITLMDGREEITVADMEKGIGAVVHRETVRQMTWI